MKKIVLLFGLFLLATLSFSQTRFDPDARVNGFIDSLSESNEKHYTTVKDAMMAQSGKGDMSNNADSVKIEMSYKFTDSDGKIYYQKGYIWVHPSKEEEEITSDSIDTGTNE